MLTPQEFTVLFAGGLLGSTHCIGMCGPYVLMSLASPGFGAAPRPGAFALFTAARLSVYVGLGALAGQAGDSLGGIAGNAAGWVSVAAGLFAFVLGLSLLGILPDLTVFLSRAGLDRVVQGGMAGARRLNGPFSPVPAPLRRVLLVLLLGGIQGLLPCGLVYAFLARAAAAGDATAGGEVMLAFGLGTVPMITALAFFSAKVAASLRQKLYRLAGVIVVMGGALLILRGLADLRLLPHGPAW